MTKYTHSIILTLTLAVLTAGISSVSAVEPAETPETTETAQAAQTAEMAEASSDPTSAPESTETAESTEEPESTATAKNAGTPAGELQGHLVKMQDGTLEEAGINTTGDTKFIALYYSAMWCPPCRAFTPLLSSFYDQWKLEKNAPFEVILVSADRTEAGMQQYMQWGEMNFPAIAYDDIRTIDLVMKHAPQQGIPSLVLLNAEGEVLAGSAAYEYVPPQIVLQKLEEVLEEETDTSS